MYPLILTAPLKDYIWGGERLKNDFGFKSDMPKIAEAWVLSCHEDGKCVVENGEFSGKTLNEILSIWGSDAICSSGEYNSLPILVKLIDAKDKLSIQVHPSDEYALKNEGDNGKTEMWYVIDCDEDAKIVYGFNRELSKDEFKTRIQDNTLDEVLNYAPAKKGDVFFVESGTVHAIGKGILIAEIQENSNVTYRVSDYGRLGADGKPRALHIDKAIEVTKLAPAAHPYGATGESVTYGDAMVRSLSKCRYFDAKLISLNGSFLVDNSESFTSLIALSNDFELIYNGEVSKVKKGGSLFIPCGVKAEIRGCCDVLSATL